MWHYHTITQGSAAHIQYATPNINFRVWGQIGEVSQRGPEHLILPSSWNGMGEEGVTERVEGGGHIAQERTSGQKTFLRIVLMGFSLTKHIGYIGTVFEKILSWGIFYQTFVLCIAMA